MHSEEKKHTAFSVNHILKAAESSMADNNDKTTESKITSDESQVKITLEESDLWRRFKTLTNEMIVTKNGR